MTPAIASVARSLSTAMLPRLGDPRRSLPDRYRAFGRWLPPLSWRCVGALALCLSAGLALCLSAGPALARPPLERTRTLARGINITGWFRYPTSHDPAVFAGWLSDAAMADLHQAGFDFARLAVDPAVIAAPELRRVLLDQVRRLQRHGLAVVISPHPVTWDLDANPGDRRRLVAFWRDLAPALRALPAALTFPETLNEPVFAADPTAWFALQDEVLRVIRAALPDATIILSGQDWGGIAGLLRLPPSVDSNVIYSFHFYDPAELTSLAAYRQGLDRAALARLPFPETGPASCRPALDSASDQPTRDLIAFWCATNWDAERVRARLRLAAAWAEQHDVALLAGEFGATAALNRGARLAWLRLVRQTCESASIGWALWGYDDVMGFGVSRPPEHRPVLDRGVLTALGLK